MNGGIVTECPECETRFNVSEGQLKLASGKVRCGACLRVFDAKSHQPYSRESHIDTGHATPPAPANRIPQPELSRTDSSSGTAMESTTLRTDPSRQDQPATEPPAGQGAAAGHGEGSQGKPGDSRLHPRHYRYAETIHPEPPLPSPAEPTPEPAPAAAAESKPLPEIRPRTRPTPGFEFNLDAPLIVTSEPEHRDSKKHSADTAPAGIPQWAPAARHGHDASRTFSGSQPVSSSAQVVPIRPKIPPSVQPQYEQPHQQPAEHTRPSAHAAAPQTEQPAERPQPSAHAAEPGPVQTAPEKPSAKQAQPIPLHLTREQPTTPRAAAVEFSLQEADQGRFHYQRHPDTASQGLSALHDLHAEPMELLHPLEPAPPAAIMGWSLGCIAASVLLAAQLLWFNRIDWSQQPQLTDFYQILCNQVDCAIPPRQAVNLIRNHQLVVRTHPRFSDALSIDLLLENTADFRQPFPAIDLNFSDIRGRTVARRLLQPSDYLDASLDPLNMPYAQPFQVNLSILDPGPRAVSYEIQLAPASL